MCGIIFVICIDAMIHCSSFFFAQYSDKSFTFNSFDTAKTISGHIYWGKKTQTNIWRKLFGNISKKGVVFLKILQK